MELARTPCPLPGSDIGWGQEEEAVPAVHGQSPFCRAATGMAAMGGAATGKVSRLASAWVTRDLGEVSEQFSEVWSRVGLVVAEVRLPGRSQAGAGGAAALAQALRRDLTRAQGSSCPRGCRPRCSLLPAPGPRGACCPALLCTSFLGASASVPGAGAAHPGQVRLSGVTSPGASGRWISDVSASVLT